jgi:hypothetical protein
MMIVFDRPIFGGFKEKAGCPENKSIIEVKQDH